MDDQVLVRYLLGELTEQERDRLEEQYFRDDATHERLQAIEVELTDAYVAGGLAPKQRARFERRFAQSAGWRDQVRFAQALAGRISEEPR